MNTFCTKCGNPIQNGAAFCTKCGAPVAQQPQPQQPAPQPYMPPQPAPQPYMPPQPAPQPYMPPQPAPQPYMPPQPAPQPYTPPQPAEPQPYMPQPVEEIKPQEPQIVEQPQPQPQSTELYDDDFEETAVVNPYMETQLLEDEGETSVLMPSNDTTQETVQEQPVSQPAPKKKGKKIGLIIGIVAAVIVLAAAGVVGWFFMTSTTNQPQEVVHSTMTAIITNRDAEEAMSYMNEEFLEALADDDDVSMYDMEVELQDEIDETFANLDSVAEKWSISWKTIKTEEATGFEYEDFVDKYADYGIDVSDVKIVEVEMSFTSSNSSGSAGDDDVLEIPVVKIGNTWYFDPDSISIIL